MGDSTSGELGGVKHWRSFGAREWNHVKSGALGLLFGTLAPVLVFYTLYRTRSFTDAVVAVLLWSTLVFVVQLARRRTMDIFSATTFTFACMKAVAGLVSQNTFLYLAFPSLENVAYGLLFSGSALLGHPVLALFARRLYPVPPEVQASPAFGRAFLVVSTVWLAGNLLRGAVRLVLLVSLPLELYLVADAVAGWPINAGLVAFALWYPLRALRRAHLIDSSDHEQAPVAQMLEQATV